MFSACGDHFEIYGIPKLIHPQNITVGDHFEMNHGSTLNATGSSIKIGSHVTISSNAQVLAATYDVDTFLKDGARKHISAPVEIGDYVWICAGALILPGVKITGSHVVIGAGSVVSNDITESNVVVAGNPARIIRKLNE